MQQKKKKNYWISRKPATSQPIVLVIDVICVLQIYCIILIETNNLIFLLEFVWISARTKILDVFSLACVHSLTLKWIYCFPYKFWWFIVLWKRIEFFFFFVGYYFYTFTHMVDNISRNQMNFIFRIWF